MPTSRRELLTGAGALIAAGCAERALPRSPAAPTASGVPAGTPPAFGTGPAVGPDVAAETLAEAEKLVRVTLTAKDRTQAAASWRTTMAGLTERRTGPRTVALEQDVAPALVWNPILPGLPGFATGRAPTIAARLVRSGAVPPLPASDVDIAFAPLTSLARWIETRKLSSERLTKIYLARLERYEGRLACTITRTDALALVEARAADAQIAAGHYRGPLHGIPYGAKDLLDTAGIRTTYGAEPFRDRVPAKDAVVIRRLREAGAVLVAKLSLGALALNDVWFGGATKNPWNEAEGSGGSSAGPAAATAAGLVGFAIGSETGGSIVGPSMRCGVTGMRPTFGKVPRTGAMTLCWSLDKLGPMTRTVEDAMLVLAAIEGPDDGDPATLPFDASRLAFDAGASVAGVKVGYIEKWMGEAPATPLDRAALEALAKLGAKLSPITLPDWPYNDLSLILFAEAAAAFEDLTLSHGVDQLAMQVNDAWPNIFRQARFLSAVDFVQAERFRRKVAFAMARAFAGIDVMLFPSLRDDMLTISNFTGHPSLTVKVGFVEVESARSDWAPDPAQPLPTFKPPRRVPHGVTLLGKLFEDGALGQVGLALERAMHVAGEHPPGFRG